MPWLETAPLPVIGLAILALLILAAEAGYRGYRRLARNRAAETGQDGQGHLLAAVLGLLALLLGFTFSLSLNRYEARRDLVLQEANAIGTTWLRAQLIAEPGRGTISALLRDYVDVRLAWSETGDVPARQARMAALQNGLWSAMGQVIRTESSTQLSRALMDAMNQSFDLAAARNTARYAHIPARVLNVLVVYAALSAVMLGYTLASGGRPHRIATLLLLVLLTLAVTLILDLDRPTSGAIQVSQQPLHDLKAGLTPFPAPAP